MTMIEATKSCLKKYFTFSGRASRSEYWNFVLVLLLASIVMSLMNAMIFGPDVTSAYKITRTSTGEISEGIHQSKTYGPGPITTVFNLLFLMPMLAVTWRRMHDIGRSGWHLLLVTAISFAVIAGTLLGFTTEVATSAQAQAAGVPEFVKMPSPPMPLIWLSLLTILATFIILLRWLTRASQAATNFFGPNPHETPS